MDTGDGVSPNASQPVLGDSDAPISLETVLRQQMEEFLARSLAENTVRGYEGEWRGLRGLVRETEPFDPLCLHLVDCAQRLAEATLDRRIAAIGRRHKVAGYTNPTTEASFGKSWPACGG